MTQHRRKQPGTATVIGLLLGALVAIAFPSAALEPPYHRSMDRARTTAQDPLPASVDAQLRPVKNRGSVRLEPCPIPGTEEEMLCGSYQVLEDRRRPNGRRISLHIAVLPPRSATPRPDPIFWLHGGPGAAATDMAERFCSSWMREDRDLVLVDQRGTGRSRPLQCKLPGSAENLQGYIEGYFDRIPLYRRCKQRLRELTNLRMYTTPIAMDDLDEVRRAMGYQKINVIGASYGSRAALIYLRRHGEHLRTLVLDAVDPPAAINPLYHAESAQGALDLLFEECAQDADCAAVFPDLAQEFDTVIRRLEETPAEVSVSHPDTGEPVTVVLTRFAFTEAVRSLMYSVSGSRWVPYLIHLAYHGTLWPITEVAIEDARTSAEILSWGTLLSVVCAEDVPRIDPADIPRLTDGTFYGEHRVRTEMAVCEIWPQAPIPASYADPIESEVPVLLLSGTLDPVTPPRWAEEAARHLANSYHLVFPGSHSKSEPCVDAITQRFVARGSVVGLNTRCAERISLPPFELPP